uniref:Neur_chan_LBD domain-containing protein n=1 Tax=Angiostrongylus cantonensis TaxID=6313 RepID=A0A0K0DGF0_ANGCA
MLLSVLLLTLTPNERETTSAVWIGPKFRDSSFVTYEMNNEIKEICGMHNNEAQRNYPWAVSITLKVNTVAIDFYEIDALFEYLLSILLYHGTKDEG